MGKEIADSEVECLKLKKAINDNHRLAQKAAGDAVERGVLVGELLTKWKELLPHGRFEPFVDTHFEGSTRTAQLYMQAAKRLAECSKAQRVALLAGDVTIEGLIGSIKSHSSREASKPISDKGKPGGRVSTPTPEPASSGPASDEAADLCPKCGDPFQTGKLACARCGCLKPDLGTCPNCGGKKWTEDEFGATCARCNQPHGEPVGDRDESRFADLRSKTIKTVEALMRAIDDLNRVLPKPEHVEAMASCKFLLKIAGAWK